MSFFDEEGQGLLEYALVLILVAVVVIAIITLLGPEISERLCQYIDVFCTVQP
jgi:pilus assembly protein Flp/PilA